MKSESPPIKNIKVIFHNALFSKVSISEIVQILESLKNSNAKCFIFCNVINILISKNTHTDLIKQTMV